MKLYLSLAAVAVLLIFVFGNSERVVLWFLGAKLEMPLAFVVIVSAVLGALASLAWNWARGKARS